MSKSLVVANWKSLKTLSESRESLQELHELLEGVRVTNRLLVALSPVALSLANEFNDKIYKLISQDVSNFAPGAHTGQTTLEQLKDLGVNTSLVGHSERRLECGESDEVVAQKTLHSLEGGLEVIFCFGESLTDRQTNQTKEVLKRQLDPLMSSLKERGFGIEKIVFAYEPVWAIGSGLTASVEDIEEVSSWVRDFVALPNLTFIYGGSVNNNNIGEILSSNLVDGVLIGSASAKPSSFLELIKISEEIKKGN